ncbi:DUF5805 domain-containing protein [Halopiger xanaduensis]|uniref:Uncharacterized protein n=1 Tax=Halopiger xanaduensis (strain DSM 18323 / JCM 14033 / SH-6) TaxID=797210 RepID=F8D846_HALXS|nr:DUF5805 domain-containing protein [Halopiger xanaduensis]AEH37939.1 hypothetical protein Halxa_3327 [Halopiger xanaduensis SH-6]
MTDDERVAVKTYVPRYQKGAWEDHADNLEMSQSEFVRTMVQAGRSDFEVPSSGGAADEKQSEMDADAETADSAGDDFADRILEVLQREGVHDWDELVDALIDDVEDDLDAALQQLQDENKVRYSGREGGYVVVGDE